MKNWEVLKKMRKGFHGETMVFGLIMILIVSLASSGLSYTWTTYITRDTVVATLPPHEEWNKTFGGSDWDWGLNCYQSTDGYLIVGFTKSFGCGGSDGWLIKTDTSGEEVWNKTFGGSGDETFHCITEATGGYMIIGETSSYGAGSVDVWMVKIDTSGNMLWNKTFGGSNIDKGRWIEGTSDGGYIIVGETLSYGAGSRDIWVIKTDQYGNELWNKTFGGVSVEYGFMVKETSDNGYVIVGCTSSYGAGGRDAWLVKIDGSGNELWNKTFGNTGDEEGWGVDVTSDNGFIVTGYTQSYGVAGSYDLWVIRVDGSGNELWNKTFCGVNYDYGTMIRETSDGYIVVGWTTSYGMGSSDVWFIGIDDSGVEKWNLTFGGTASDEGRYVGVTSDDGYIITGYTSSYGHGWYDAWLIKITPENRPPNRPNRPSGPTSGVAGEIYTYTTSSVDPDDDLIRYGWDWNGDNIVDEWTGYYPSSTVVSCDHSWSSSGVYHVKVKAEDINGLQSNFSLPLNVTITSTNNPPSTPSRPSGPTSGVVGVEYRYTTSSVDPDGDDIRYGWDIDGDNVIDYWTPYHTSGATVEFRITFDTPGTYPLQVKAEDINGARSDFSPTLIVTITSGENHPPDKPDRPSGEMNGRVGKSYTYYSRTTDPDDDKVYYMFDWGDGTTSGWIGPFTSGSTVSASHVWTTWGTYDVRVKAKDVHGAESSWSDPLPVSMPKSKCLLSLVEEVIQHRLTIRELLHLLLFF